MSDKNNLDPVKPTKKNTPRATSFVLSLLKALKSVAAAAFGVQSRSNHAKDFSASRLKLFIFAGVLFTVFFVFAVIFLAEIALKNLN